VGDLATKREENLLKASSELKSLHVPESLNQAAAFGEGKQPASKNRRRLVKNIRNTGPV